MKRKLLILVLALVFCFIGCKKDKTDFVYDKENPEAITIDVGEDIVSVALTDKVTKTNVSSSLFNGKVLTFDSNYFMNVFSGTYSLEITTKNNVITKSILITNYISSKNMTTKEEMFDINEYAYYVIYTKESCSFCEKARNDLSRFNDFGYNYDSPLAYNVYYIDGATSTISGGTDNDLIGVDSSEYLLSYSSMGTPSLMFVQNKVITEVANGPTNIKAYVNDKINFVKNAEVLSVDLSSPVPLIKQLDFTPTNYTFRGPAYNDLSKDATPLIKDNTVTLKEDFLMELYNGTYELYLYNSEKSKSIYFNTFNGLDYTYKITGDEDFKIDKDTISDLVITDQENVNYITIVGNHYYKKITDLSSIYTGTTITLSKDLINSLYSGKYQISIYKTDATSRYILLLQNFISTFSNVTDKRSCFDGSEDNYLVYYSRSGCAYCSRVQPYLFMFNDFLENSNNIGLPKLYIINTEYGSEYIASNGTNTNLTGMNSSEQLINDAQMGTPTLMFFDKKDGKNTITSYQTSYTDIIKSFYSLIKKSNCETFINKK